MPTLLNQRHERFAQELASGKSDDAAYVAAGYVSNRGNAHKLKQTEDIRRRLAELLDERERMHGQATAKAVERTALTKEWVIARLRENALRALQAVPVTNAEGEEVGQYQYNGAVANKALELLGKTLGMFIERHEVGQPGDFARMSDDELDGALTEQARALGLPEEAVGRLLELRAGNSTEH